MFPYKFIVPTQSFFQNHPRQGRKGKDNRPFKLYLVFIHDPRCCLKVSSIVRVCSDSTNLPDNSALFVRRVSQCPVPSHRTLRHSCRASGLYFISFSVKKSSSRSNSPILGKTFENRPFSIAQYAFFHSVGERESSDRAAVPIFRSTAGPITKGAIPRVSSESRIAAVSEAKT